MFTAQWPCILDTIRLSFLTWVVKFVCFHSSSSPLNKEHSCIYMIPVSTTTREHLIWYYFCTSNILHCWCASSLTAREQGRLNQSRACFRTLSYPNKHCSGVLTSGIARYCGMHFDCICENSSALEVLKSSFNMINCPRQYNWPAPSVTIVIRLQPGHQCFGVVRRSLEKS